MNDAPIFSKIGRLIILDILMAFFQLLEKALAKALKEDIFFF